MNVRLAPVIMSYVRSITVTRKSGPRSPETRNDQAKGLVIRCGQGRGRTADLPIFRHEHLPWSEH